MLSAPLDLFFPSLFFAAVTSLPPHVTKIDPKAHQQYKTHAEAHFPLFQHFMDQNLKFTHTKIQFMGYF